MLACTGLFTISRGS